MPRPATPPMMPRRRRSRPRACLLAGLLAAGGLVGGLIGGATTATAGASPAATAIPATEAADPPPAEAADPPPAEAADPPQTEAADPPQTEAADPPQSEAAYRLQSGSIARSRIVALGRDLIVDGEARSHAVALSGDATVSGTVAGDLIVLDGDVQLADSAAVAGDVYVLGGAVDAAPGATIGGRSVAYPDASSLWVGLVQGPVLGAPPLSAAALGSKLALLAFWSFMVLLLFAVGRRELVATSDAIRDEPFRHFFVGLTGVAALVLTALFFSAFTGAILGVPLLVLVAVVALVLRFWGMVAVFHALGHWLHRRIGRRAPLPLAAATWGLLALGLAKLVPYLGIWTWSVATFIGVGAALSTKLGRRETWFEA